MVRKWTVALACLILLNSAYLSAFADPSLLFVLNVLAHVTLGLVFVVLLAVSLWGDPRLGFLTLVLAAGGLGLYLMVVGATRPHRWALWSHIAFGVLVMLVLALNVRQRGYTALLVSALIFPLAIAGYHRRYPHSWDTIRNSLAPLSMDGEGDGPGGPFFPSSAQTVSGGKIPSNFFMESESCKGCHPDIFQQWNSSMHHFASFNNQFYRKSIEHMQEVTGGPKPSKWCAGCHDHALLFNGKFDQPIREVADTPEGQAGLGCMSCHAIVQVGSTMGNGGFRIEYPALHNMAVSKNKVIQAVSYFVTRTAPQAHRRIFMKPFMRNSAEFCSSCHKVHLDVPVNSYRWIRGFNEYDAWQASGVSGQGARSFYYPKESSTCSECHMPKVKSNDMGNVNGMVHSHRFPAANTAVAAANHDAEQLRITEEFLKSGNVSVDVFALVRDEPAAPVVAKGGEAAPHLSTTFAVGEEAMGAAGGVVRPAAPVLGPLDRVQPELKPGETVRVEVVVRTRKVGHFFPGGTVDAFDVWVELEAQDESGRTIFHSGYVEDNGRGPVEPGAHFYRSFMLDKDGNPINKRNAFETRSVLYARLIPPGAADVVHYRMRIPADVKGRITLKAKVNYRKFSHYYTHFSHDGSAKPVPDVPIVTVAESTVTLPSSPVNRKDDRERWNDYGIGLLLQGDLKAAEAAFRRVTEIEPGYADGWLNVARCFVQEGETEAAAPWIEKALALQPRMARARFFKALVLKAAGNYDGALSELAMVLEQYPRDRVALNQVGRLYFLKRQFPAAIAALDRVLQVDPEDLQAHYNLMLSQRGAGNQDQAAREEKLYLRFKAEESSQSITGDYRRIHAEDNNERQSIHEHGEKATTDGHR